MIDEDIKGESKTAWCKQDVLTAVKMLLNDKNPLFESLIGKLNEYPGVKNLIYRLLFRGENIGYNPDDSGIDMAENVWIYKSSKWKCLYCKPHF